MINSFTLDKITKMVEPMVTSLNCQLYHIEYVNEAGENYLRIYIDSEAGITLDDCEKVSREVSDFLDEEDPIDEAYTLEVSSPGIDRTLFTNTHLQRYQGSKVKVKLLKSYNGKKAFEGLLVSFSDEFVSIKVDNEEINIPRVKIKYINLVGEL